MKVKDGEELEQYIRQYREKQGIQLDAQDIKLNLAKRQMTKFCLYMLWEKFAEKNHRTQTTLVSDEQFFDFVFGKVRRSLLFLSDG